MAALVEQPIKKRKLYDHPSAESNINSHLSHDEILLKRRNWDEISRIYASYKLIKLYANSQSVKKAGNPKILSSVTFQDFEQAYFSMLNASQGCASVQRIVAEMIPRYVLYCPPALEAACRVLIQIGKWSTTAVQDKVNSNGIIFETMKACYFGLVDISNAAIAMTRDKLVASNITSIIFQIQLSFLIQQLNGKGLYAFEEMDMERLSGTEENFTELPKKLIDNDDSAGESMWKLSSLTILRILFCCPQNMLSACFDFLCSEDVERHREGYSFLSLIMGENALCVKSLSESKSNSTLDSFKKEDSCKLIDTKSEKNSMAKKKSEGSLIAKVLKRNHSVRLWMRSRLQKLCKVNVSDVVSTATTKLSELLDSFPLSQSHLNIHDDTDLDKLQDYGKNTELMLPKPSADKHSEAFSMTEHARFRNVTNSAVSSMLNDSNLSDDGKRRKPRYLFNSQQSDQKSGEDSCYQHYRRSSSFEDDDKNYLQEGDFKNLTSGRTFMKENLSNSSNSYSHSSWTPERKYYSTRTKGGCFSFEDNPRSSYNEYHESTPRREANGSSLILPAKQPMSSKSYSSPSHGQVAWYSDGDPAAMDVFAASNQLWVGSLGRDVLESSLKLHFERFGPVEKVSLFSPLDFGLVEFKNIIDAVKAREYMQGLSPWGSPLRVKFLDPGLGSRGAIAGAAVGGSCHVYLGKVPTNRVKEEILKDFISSGLKGPYTVLHLVKSNALLMEFDAPEEAAAVMAHIRQRRRETRDHVPSPTSFKMLTGQPSLSEGQNYGNRHLHVGHVDGCVSEEGLINAFKQIGDLSGWNFLRQNSCCFIDFVSAESASLAKSRLNGVRFGSQHIVVDFDNGRTGTSTFSGLSPTKEKQNSSLLSLLSLLCKKYNLNSRITSSSCTKSRNERGFIGQEGTEIVPTNTLCIQLPDMDFNFLDETEIKTVFNLAAGTIGKVTKIKSTKTSSGPCIFVELNSVEAASMALKNMSGQLGPCIQIEYSNSIISLQQSEQSQTLLQANSLHLKPHSEKSQQLQICSHSSQTNSKDHVSTNYWDHRHDEFQSPKLSCHGLGILGAYPSGWSSGSALSEKVDSTDRSEAIYEKPALKNSTLSSTTSINTSTCSDSFLSKCASVENFSVSHSSNHAWIGSKAASDKVSGPNLVQQAPTMNPLPATKGTVYMNREHVSVNLPWAGHGLISTTSMDQISPTAKTLGQLNLNTNVCGGLFVPPRISPLGQTLGGLPVSYEFLNPNMTLRPFSVLPPLPSEIPPPPPPPSSPPPPPPPLSNFPIVPPPPSSPPPPPPPPPSDPLPVEWKGALCKSGVQYCTAMAIREPSSACNYTCTSPEPTEWPVKLDVTKRTDFKSVKHTFHNTPPNKREVCRLFPFSGDNNKKGFEELINYLKQRECAGVVRIPEGHSVWSRILFLLPYSSEACTMLEITLHSDNSLIGLILSKETSFDWI